MNRILESILQSHRRHPCFNTRTGAYIHRLRAGCPAAPAAPARAPLKDIVSEPLSITILHNADTHSYVMPHDLMLKLNGRDTLVALGGYGPMASAVEDIRQKEKNVILLSGGDVTEGTIWMPKFEGMADFAAMNALKFDAVTLGNHEFASGTQLANKMVDTIKFPVLAANLDLSQEPALAAKVKPYTILEYGGQKIGVIGLITPDTPGIASPGKTVKFLPAEGVARQYISELNGLGINKIVILSHLGYEPDLKLAGAVPGIDIIVGGHSHTFMGGPEFSEMGLNPVTPYPTVVTGPAGDKVLIVHAWESNQMLGQIKLDFDDHGRDQLLQRAAVHILNRRFQAGRRNRVAPCGLKHAPICGDHAGHSQKPGYQDLSEQSRYGQRA